MKRLKTYKISFFDIEPFERTGDEFRIEPFWIRTAIFEHFAIYVCDHTACGLQDRISCSRIPFTCRAEARVDVGLARRDNTNFQ